MLPVALLLYPCQAPAGGRQLAICGNMRPLTGAAGMQMERHETEEAMLDALVEAVRALDPDILLGWEVQQGSLGYLVDRAAVSERPLLQQLSRTPKVTDIAFLLSLLPCGCTGCIAHASICVT